MKKKKKTDTIDGNCIVSAHKALSTLLQSVYWFCSDMVKNSIIATKYHSNKLAGGTIEISKDAL